MENTKNRMQPLVIGLKLLLICAVVAGIVSFVYALTLDRYEENLAGTRSQAIGEIFGKEGLTCETFSETADGTVYKVYDGDTLAGYCAEVTGSGFGGDIGLMVGYDTGKTILGVSVISNSETPGVGSKVMDPAYLVCYQGKSGELTIGADVDAVSGATVSSKGILSGVNLAGRVLDAALGN